LNLRNTTPFGGQAVGIIPARAASTRFPNKPLALIHGLPMVVWTLRRAAKCSALREVFVAAEDEAIVEAVLRHGGQARLVRGDFAAGSDRVAAAARNLDAPAVVNIQADEPLIEPAAIEAALALLERRPEFGLTTVVRPLTGPEEYADPNCVKAVLDGTGRCLYFSRSPLPALRHRPSPPALPPGIPFYRHVGLYCFRRTALDQFTELPPSPLERAESLEQLRWLEAGGAMGAVPMIEFAPGIDTPEDLLALERYLDQKGIFHA